MHDIAEFLGDRDPFSRLDEAALEALAAEVEVEFFAAGTTIYQPDQATDAVRAVRRGAVGLYDDGRLVDLLEEGELFGQPSALSGRSVQLEARAAEDALTYLLPASRVVSLLAASRPAGRGEADLLAAPASALVRGAALEVGPDASLRDVARAMTDAGRSAAIVRTDEGSLGIVTDHDLRAKAVAEKLPAETPISIVTTTPVIGVAAERPGTEVMLAMLEHDVHHVAVLSERSEIIGIIDSIDLLAADRRGPLSLRRAISEAGSRTELEEAASGLNPTVVSMHRAGMSPARIAEAISAIADSLTRRAIELAETELGEAPAEFAWLALGSHGRREPAPSSDVDSGMAWRDPGRAGQASESVTAYMRAIAGQVADCMRAIGWTLDPHGVTATGDFSASSVDEWRAAVHDWLERQTDDRVALAVSITMDARVVRGPAELDPRSLLWDERRRSRLLRAMLRSAVASRPPTGFLRDLVVEHGGEHRGTFDIKEGGIGPVVNLARVAALSAESRGTPTIARLRAARDSGTLEDDEASSLEHAFALFSELRLEHQVRQLERGERPDDHLDPKTLDPLRRRYLRDAFREVAAIQRSMERKLEMTRGRI